VYTDEYSSILALCQDTTTTLYSIDSAVTVISANFRNVSELAPVLSSIARVPSGDAEATIYVGTSMMAATMAFTSDSAYEVLDSALCTCAVFVRDVSTLNLFIGCGLGGIFMLSPGSSTMSIPRRLTSNKQTPNVHALTYANGVLYVAMGYIPGTSGLFAAISDLGSDGVSVVMLPSIAACFTPLGLYIDPITSVLFAACGVGGVVAMHNGEALSITSPMQCSNAVSISGDTRSGVIFVACPNEGVLSIVSQSITVV
jgi:hypothetical protein